MAARILVVEDDGVLRELLINVLRRARFAAVGANNGSDALEQLAEGHFDLMLSDVRMSPVGGLALVARAKALAPDIKVLLMTTYAQSAEASLARAAGADSYLSKPFPMADLLKTVRALVRQRLRPGKRVMEDEDQDRP